MAAGKVSFIGILVLVFLYLIWREVQASRAVATTSRSTNDDGGCC